ncbi:unnamed protein product, partial (macronuclear) [Paramecium tetraurelia]
YIMNLSIMRIIQSLNIFYFLIMMFEILKKKLQQIILNMNLFGTLKDSIQILPNSKSQYIYWTECLNYLKKLSNQSFQSINRNLIQLLEVVSLYPKIFHFNFLKEISYPYFPGDIMYFKNCFPLSADNFINLIEDQDDIDCTCEQNLKTSIADVIIEKQNQYEFVSQKSNCQEFLLASWVKIQEIYLSDDEFDYQFIRLCGNFQHPQFIQQNLCAFQLFYKISSSKNQIIITTYSYNFPVVDIDFSSNPFLKSKAFDVTSNIKLWHYILVKKLENSISVSITFYNNFKKEEFKINLNVQQFNKMQFKLLYGNLLQSSPNYLTIKIVGLQFFNCLYFIRPQVSCHPTCQECDGPTKDDCLSCFKNSNRIYLPDYKQCICEYGSIDLNNKCVNYQVLGLILNQENPSKKECKCGFFEIEGDCQ